MFGDKFENLWRLICPKIEILVTDLTHFSDWDTSQYIGEFEMLILNSPIVIGEFWLIFSYVVMLIWREFLEISSFWREIQLNLERAGETNGEFVTHTI